MIKRTLIAAVSAAACGLAAAPSLAADTANEPLAMLYLHQDFGGSARSGKSAPSYGFAVSRSGVNTENGYSASNPLAFLQGGRPAFVDMRFNDTGIQGLYVNGLNSLERKMVYNAAEGTAGTEVQINWGAVITGVIVGAVVVDVINDDECKPGPAYALNVIPNSCGDS